MAPAQSRTPVPFIVGAPRSGTTLLRLMLDAHSDLAIPAETGFFTLLADAASRPDTPAAMARFLTQSPNWSDFGLDEAQVTTRLAMLPSFSVADGLRAFYEMYAARQHKSRWGRQVASTQLQPAPY